jgi:hypothetical protein
MLYVNVTKPAESCRVQLCLYIYEFGACLFTVTYVSVQAYNKKLLSNILPVHVAEFFMSGDKNNDVSNGTAQAH